MKLENWTSTEEKARWKCVRTDNYTDVPGDIVIADEATGECTLSVLKADHSGTEEKTFSFGPGGIRIIGRKR